MSSNTTTKGEILWANPAYEKLVGYTSSELIGKITWIELTASRDDAEHDHTMAMAVVAGERREYIFAKSYVHKSGERRPVEIHVRRWPQSGEFECFLVSVVSLDVASEVIERIETMRCSISDICEKRNSLDRFVQVCEKHPIIAAVIATVVSSLLFGDRIVEVIRSAIGLTK